MGRLGAALHCLLLLAAAVGGGAEPAAKPIRGFQAALEEKAGARQQQAPAPQPRPQEQLGEAAGRQLQRGPPPEPLGACQAPPHLPPRQQQQQQQQQRVLQRSVPTVGLGLAVVAGVLLFACGVAVGAALQHRYSLVAVAVEPATVAEPAGPQAAEKLGTASSQAAAAAPAPAAAAASAAAEHGPAAARIEALQPTGSGTLQRQASWEEVEPAQPAAAAAPEAAEADDSSCTRPEGEGRRQAADALPAIEEVQLDQQQQRWTGQPSEAAKNSAAVASAAAVSGSGSAAVLAMGSAAGMTVSAVAGSAVSEADRADIAAAGALVAELTRSLHIDLGALSAGERLQLLHTVLQAWQAQQAKRHGEAMARLGSEANALQGKHVGLVVQRAQHELARDAYALAARRTAHFRRACADALTLGLGLMLAAAGWQAAHGGGAAAAAVALFSQCGRWGSAMPGPWGLFFRSWGSLRTAGCYLLTAGDAALGLLVILAAPWAVYRSGMLGRAQSAQSMPITRLLLGLGLACGVAGYVAVGKLGGSRMVWLCAWEAWVAVQLAFAAAAHRLFRVGAGQAASSGEQLGVADSMYERSFAWLHVLMWALVGVVLPLAAGWLPFRV